jgi:SAM-dependent methyltransferase
VRAPPLVLTRRQIRSHGARALATVTGVPDKPVYFDERVAARYDASSADRFDPAVLTPTVDFLAELAGGDGGTALELGIGTGRVALPLAERGVRVHGIDLSPAMVEQLRAKPGAERIETTIGDFATTRVDGSFRLAYLVYNTITNLTTQDEQVDCFCNVASHLEPGGCFVVEVGVPDLRVLPPGEHARVFTTTPSYVGFDEYTDIPGQVLYSHHWRIVDDDSDDTGAKRARVFSAPYRWVWPSELDLMARIAGMRLRERWGGWRREPFTGDSRSHVSVWEKPILGR